MPDDFQYIKLPDGSYGKFNATASDDQIKAAIAKDFPDAFKPAAQPSATSRYLSNAGQEIGGMLKGAWDLVKPPTSIPEVMNRMTPGGGVPEQLIVQPFIQKVQSAYQAFKQGDPMKGTLGALAAANPLAPDVTKLYEQSASGDVAGAAGKGSIQAATLLAGPTLAKVVPALTPKIIPESLKAPLAEVMSKPRGTTPAEAATPADLKAYASANGIRVNAAQLTEHNLPRNLQSAGERATVGGTGVKQQIAAAQSDVANHVSNLMDSMSPAPDNATAGAAVQQSIGDALAKHREVNNAMYEKVDTLAKGGRIQVDLTPVKQAAQDMLQDSRFIRDKVPGLDPKRASSILRSLSTLPDKGTFSDAQAIRSGLLDESMHPDNVMSDQAQGWFKRMTGLTDQQMMDAASKDPDLSKAFRSANDQYKQLQQDFNSPRSPFYQTLKEPDPGKIAQKFSQKGQTGGSPFNAQLLDKYGIDKGPVQRMVLQDMMNRDFRMFSGKTLTGYSDEFLRSLYSPEELDAIYKTGALARSVNLQANPSGTAVVTGAMEDVKSPVRSMLPKGIAAKLTKSQRFNDYLTRTAPLPQQLRPNVQLVIPATQGSQERQ